MPFDVLFVCTGNVCRSPSAELLLRQVARPEIRSSSAGLAALEADPIDTPTATALQRLGVDPTAHRARQLSWPMVATADLVLTAEAEQRDQIMTEFPSAFRRTFTIKEFTRAAGELAVLLEAGSDPRMVVALASQHRGEHRPVDPTTEDIADAYRASYAHASATVVEIGKHVDALVRALRIRRPRPVRQANGGITALPSG